MPSTQEIPGIFTIFGITGDLAARKIIPSLWHLQKESRLPEKFSVFGFARRELPREAFEEIVRSSVEKAFGDAVTDETFAKFFALFEYHAGTFENLDSYASLAAKISARETAWGECASKLYYLAVPPSSYEKVFEGLASAKLNVPCGDAGLGWSRVLIEKPFGHDLKSARELQTLLSTYFKEDQIYQIDHYLFKEILQGIENFRFSNNLFERIWDNTTVERIDIRLHESIGVESRGSFYDSVGTLRDVGQNHLLMMLAAVTMEYTDPAHADIADVRRKRADILATLRTWTEELVRSQTYRAQYENYQSIVGVQPDSATETYFALQTELTHPRWKGVPIFLEAGKRLAEARKEMILTLRHAGKNESNRIVFRLEPNNEILIYFWTKKPGFEHLLEERTLSFSLYEKTTHVPYVEEYAKVIYSAMTGEQSFFVSPEEVEALWKFTDPIIQGWKENLVPLEHYAPDTTPQPALIEHSDSDIHDIENSRGAGEIGFIGLGKMGGGLARQLHDKGWNVRGYDPTSEVRNTLSKDGIQPAESVSELVASLPHPRVLWLMVPHQVVDDALKELVPLLEKGDTIIDGGNSPYKESVRRHEELEAVGINFLDAGVSGGPAGARNGACIMIGGKQELFEKFESLFRDMSLPDGYAYVGAAGAGHFVKMVHNGIEYGMMQAIGEGFEVLKVAPLGIDVEKAAELYQHGSVIESRLIGWLSSAYEKYGPELSGISSTVAASGEGQWTVDAARELGVPVAIIEGALEFRKTSGERPSYTGKVVSSLRNQFGGHDASERTSHE